jgi:hypothetical protein
MSHRCARAAACGDRDEEEEEVMPLESWGSEGRSLVFVGARCLSI